MGEVEGISYWAYVPNPPIIQPVGWLDREPIKVLTNDSVRMGGAQGSDERYSTSSLITFEGRADSLPICLSLKGEPPSGCLPTSYRTFLADGPDKTSSIESGISGGKKREQKRWMWERQLQVVGQALYNDNCTVIPAVSMPTTPCELKFPTSKSDELWDSSLTKNPTWLSCGFHNSATFYDPDNLGLRIWDFSNSICKRSWNLEHYINAVDRFHGYRYERHGEPLRRWFSPGYVEPILYARKGNKIRKHLDLFRLSAAANMILEKRPNQTKSEPISVKACVAYPNALLLVPPTGSLNISAERQSYRLLCYQCVLTNCIGSTVQKKYYAMLIVRRPPFIMLPVELGKNAWYDNSALQVLDMLSELLRPKRFVASLILGITALISIVTTFAVATTALENGIRTAHYVNTLNRNITMALLRQEAIDQKLEAKINVLEEVVLALGQDIANLKTMFSARCHSSFKSICVTPLLYNTSQPWEKVKAHVQGVWHDNDITHDLHALQKEIAVVSQSRLQLGDLNELAESIGSGIKALNPINWKNYLIYIGVLAAIVLVVILLFPGVFKCILTSLRDVQQEVFELRLKNKGGIATPTAVPSA